MKELDIFHSTEIIGGVDSFAKDLGQYFGGYTAGYLLGGGLFPAGVLLGSIMGTMQMMK